MIALWRLAIILGLLAALAACAIVPVPDTVRVALLAPFEGRYAEVGYDLLYAARLGVSDNGNPNVELLPIDDGGTVAAARQRAAALVEDPLVTVVLVAGYPATDPATLSGFGDLPVIVIGHWGVEAPVDSAFVLASAGITRLLDSPRMDIIDAAQIAPPVTGGEVFALKQFPTLRDNLTEIAIVTSASLPDDDFTTRYQASDLFAPEPGLLATLAYDAAAIATRLAPKSRSSVTRDLTNDTFDSLNGRIRFANGYWSGAPIHVYRYVNGELQLRPD